MTENTPRRVALWCAVSSKAQAADDKTSLADQEAAGRKFAEAIGGHIVRVYQVPGHSRDYVLWTDAEAAMPAYRQLREDCAAHAFDVLHAADPDRLGRSEALAFQVIGLVENAGAEIYLASAPHQIGQPAAGQRYLYAIQSVRGSEMQEIRRGRHRRGMRGRISRGLPAGYLPYGYCAVRDARGRMQSAEFTDDIGAIRLITDMFLRGATYASICQALNASPYRARRSSIWRYSTVRSICANDAYGGYPKWGEYKAELPSTRYPALWKEITYRAILRERERRSGDTRRRGTNTPLYRVAMCGVCSEPMIRNSNYGNRYLRCRRRARSRETGLGCPPNSLREDVVFAELLAWLDDVLETEHPERLDGLLAQVAPGEDLLRRLEDAEGVVGELAQRRDRVALAFAAGQMDVAMYRRTDDVLLGALERAEMERAALRQRIAALPDPAQRRDAFEELRVSLDHLLDLPPLEANTKLRNAGIRVDCVAGKVEAVLIV